MPRPARSLVAAADAGTTTLKDALSRVTARAGYSNGVEAGYEVGAAAPSRAGSRADIEARLPPPHGPALLDVSLTHTHELPPT